MRGSGSFRILRKHWKLTVVAVFSLTVAMALGVLTLSVSNTFLLAPPAAPQPDRLVMIRGRSPIGEVDQLSYPDFEYLREHNHVFTDIAAAPNSINISGDMAIGAKALSRPVSENYFAVLGIRAARGRLLAPGDEKSKTPVAVMTDACWKRLGSDPNIVGKVLFGDTIVGVTPEDFTGGFYGLNGDLFIPLSDSNYNAAWRNQREVRGLLLLARLKPGVSRREAQAEISSLSGQLASAYPKEDKDRAAVVERATLLPPDAVATAELTFGILLGVVMLVLLIACGNVANLLLAVAVGRRQEAAIKLALGAQRGRLIREFMRESVLFCAASTALGWAAAAAIISRYSHVDFDFGVLGTLAFGVNLRLDAAVAGFTVLLTLIAILATGLAPALYASSPHLAAILGGEIVVGGTRKNMRRNILVIAQVAICTLVLVGMGLCRRNLYNLRHVDPGFSARDLVGVQVYPSKEGAAKDNGNAQLRNVYQRVRSEVGALAGVESVALAWQLPLSLGFGHVSAELPDHGKKADVAQNTVDENYFDTFGIPVLQGRVFNSGDREGGPEVAVINRKMAETFWPGQNPLGKIVMVGNVEGSAPRPTTVIGVTANGKYSAFDEPDDSVVYTSLNQHPQAGFSLVARTKGDPRLWIEPLERVMQSENLISVFRPLTYESWSSFTLLLQRITATVAEGLSALGLLLAVMGLAGAISYSVSERKKELGIRVALGAGEGRLMSMILRQTLVVAGAGIAIGIALGTAATAALRSEFFGIGVVEWTVLLPVGAGMLVAAIAVAYLSAKPWIAVNPMDAVRHS